MHVYSNTRKGMLILNTSMYTSFRDVPEGALDVKTNSYHLTPDSEEKSMALTISSMMIDRNPSIDDRKFANIDVQLTLRPDQAQLIIEKLQEGLKKHGDART